MQFSIIASAKQHLRKLWLPPQSGNVLARWMVSPPQCQHLSQVLPRGCAWKHDLR